MINSLTPERCLEILTEAGCDEDVIKHCRAVSTLAVKIAEKIPGADTVLVRTGSLLHDIGRAKTHDIKHVASGVIIARELGLPEDVIAIIKSHIGAGILPDEASDLGLPEGDYIPRTIEQKIVAHADNLIDYFEPVPVRNILEKLSARGHESAVERVSILHRELSELAGFDLDELVGE